MTFEDNQDNVYSFPANSPVHVELFILAGHAGTANLSVVDVDSNEVGPVELVPLSSTTQREGQR